MMYNNYKNQFLRIKYSIFLVLVIFLLLFDTPAAAITKESVYYTSNGTLTQNNTKICLIVNQSGICPTPDFYTPQNVFHGYYCINQLTPANQNPTSGTNITYASYTNNSTQWFYQFMVSGNGFTSCGYCPVSSPEISINRRRIFPSYANMITTVGNNYCDFNIHQGSCHLYDHPTLANHSHTFTALSFDTGSYQCGPCILLQEYNTGSTDFTGYLMWCDLDTTIPASGLGVMIYQYRTSGIKLNTCICGMALAY